MRSIILLTIGLSLAASIPSEAATFERARLLPEMGIDALTRDVARAQVGRDVFSEPWAAVTIGSVDVYAVFPYVETRSFEVVSDPRWNRLVYGEAGRTLKAFDGASSPFGALKGPRGMAVDERHRIYVADAGNDRIVALDASTEYGELTLVPAFEIRGLSNPYAVAYSDGGTPFRTGDDFLYVADTGRNRILAYTLGASGATFESAIGEMGSGPGRFAGPMALTAGHAAGAGTPDVYVADAHSRRIVRLRHEAGAFRWVSAADIDADLVTSLDSDQWGNVYAAAPRAGLVRKFSPSLVAVADLRESLNSPRGFHVPFVNVTDHRDGAVARVGRPSGLAVESWSGTSGLKLWNLGLELNGLAVSASATPEARFDLTDRAAVTLEWVDATSGQTLGRRALGELDAGAHRLSLDAEEASYAGANQVLRVTAASSYGDGRTVTASTRPAGGATVSFSKVQLLGNAPNPVMPATRISFALPAGNTEHSSLDIFDAGGRRVRHLGSAFGPGLNEVNWDGNDDGGRPAEGGVYFYRLQVGTVRLSRKLVVVR